MTGVSNVGEPTNSLQVVFHVLVMACALVLFAYAIGVAAVIEEAAWYTSTCGLWLTTRIALKRSIGQRLL